MTDFATWLERQKFDDAESIPKSRMNEDFISVRALGNWAWDEVWKKEGYTLKAGVKSAGDKYIKILFGEVSNLKWQIAIACLGKKEVTKRLKEASK